MVNLSHRVQVVFSEIGSAQLGRGLQSIAQYSTQAQQGLNQTGLALDKMKTNTQAVGNNISIFGKNMQGLSAGTTQANQGLSIFNQSVTASQGGLTKQNTLLGQTAEAHKTLGTSMKSAASGFSTLAIGISTTAQGAISLARNYRDLNDLQINIDRTARKLSLAQEALDKANRKVADAQKAIATTGGDAAKEAQALSDALRDQEQASEMVSVQTRMLEEQQEAFGDFQMNFAVSIIPTVIGAVGTMGQAFASAGIKVSDLIPKMRALAAAMGLGSGGLAASAVAAAGPLAAVLASIIALADIIPKLAANEKEGEIFRDPTQPLLERLKARKAQIDKLLAPVSFDWNFFSGIGAGLARLGIPQERIDEIKQEYEDITAQIAELEKTEGGATVTEKQYGDQIAQTSKVAIQRKEADAQMIVGMEKLTPLMLMALEASGKALPIEVQLAIARMNLANQTKSVSTAQTTMTQGQIAGNKQFMDLISNTEVAVAQEERYRAQLIMYVQDQNLAANATALSTQQLELLVKADLGDTEAKKQLTAETQKHANAISDLANKYQIKLNPAMGQTEKQLQDLTAALGEWKSAVDELRDPEELFGLKPFKIKFEIEKEFQDFFKDLPKGLRRDITFSVKSLAANKNAADLMGLMAKTQLQTIELGIDFRPKETDADKFIGEFIDQIKEQFKRKGKDLAMSPDIKAAIDKMLEIKDAPDSWTKITEYFQSPQFLNAIKKIDPQTAALVEAAFGSPAEVRTEMEKYAGNFMDQIAAVMGKEKKDVGLFDLLGTGKGYKGKDKGPQKIDVDTTEADKKIAAVKKAIIDLGAEKPQISLQNRNAINAIDVTRDLIIALQDYKPYINLQNTVARKKVGEIANMIDNLSDIKPKIDVDNTPAIRKVDQITRRIQDLPDGEVTVKVKYDTSGKPSGLQHGGAFISTEAQVWKGHRISEYNKAELNVTVPLTDPNNINQKIPLQAMNISKQNIDIGGLGSPNQFFTIHNIIRGNDIVRSQDIWSSVAPRMGRNMARYMGT